MPLHSYHQKSRLWKASFSRLLVNFYGHVVEFAPYVVFDFDLYLMCPGSECFAPEIHRSVGFAWGGVFHAASYVLASLSMSVSHILDTIFFNYLSDLRFFPALYVSSSADLQKKVVLERFHTLIFGKSLIKFLKEL